MLISIYLICLVYYVLIFSILEIKYNKDYEKAFKKKNLNLNLMIIGLLLFHNAVYFSIYFTLLFILYYSKNIPIYLLYLYLILLIYILIHWYLNNNKCWITLKQNELLDLDKDIGFRDCFSILMNYNTKTGSLKNINKRDKFYYIYIYFAIMTTLILLFGRNKIIFYF